MRLGEKYLKDHQPNIETPAKKREVAPTAVANQIEQLRRGRGMTLQSFANITGVAASTLSKIERDELSPTISTLQKITKGLGIEMADLFAKSNGKELAPGRRSVTRASSGKGYTTSSCENQVLCSEIKNKKFVPVLTRVVARSVDDYPAWAKSDAEIFLMVIKGQMQLHSELYEPLDLGPGDSVYYDASAEHAWISIGEEDAEVVWVFSP